jgi:hypothetical protein
MFLLNIGTTGFLWLQHGCNILGKKRVSPVEVTLLANILFFKQFEVQRNRLI